MAFLIEPTLAQHTGSALLHIVSAVYPPIDVLLLLILLQLAFTDVSGAPSFWFLSISLARDPAGRHGLRDPDRRAGPPVPASARHPFVLAYGFFGCGRACTRRCGC